MANATSANTKIGIVAETVFGTTPSTPALTAQRFASASFNLTKPELLDNSITGQRDYSYVMTGNKTVAGSLSGSLSHDNYDTLLETAMFNAWATNTLKNGNTKKSVTLEIAQPDVPSYRNYTGVIANSFTVNAPVDGTAEISFEFVGLAETVGTTSIDANGYTAQPTRQPFTHCGGLISEGGTPLGYANGVSFTLTNNITPAFYWGDCDAGDLIEGRTDITGTLDVFFANNTLYNKFVSSTYSSISVTLNDGQGNTLTFTLPKIMYTGGDQPISGDGQIIVSLPFRAVYDPVTQCSLSITRSA